MEFKTALITGGTSGIGLSIAREFAKSGYNLVLNGLEKEGPEISSEISKEFYVKTYFFGANLANTQEIKTMMADALKKTGGIDVLINNAGIQHVCPVEDFPDDRWNSILAINLSSAFYLSKACWKTMKTKHWGRIINIASVHGLVASEFKSAYVTAKHGLVGLTKVLALEGAPYGITANAICPGYVRTPLVENQIKDQSISHGIPEEKVISEIMLAKHAIKDFVSPEEIANLALFLASENGKLITGTAIPVDGGWSAQ